MNKQIQTKDKIDIEYENLDEYKKLLKKKENIQKEQLIPSKSYKKQLLIDNGNNEQKDYFETHYNIGYNTLKDILTKPFYGIKNAYFNELFGEFTYRGYDEAFSHIYKQTIISNELFKKKHLDMLLPQEAQELNLKDSEMNLDYKENFNFRIFKYLNNYNDLYFTSSDLSLRQSVISSYVFHILNHIIKNKELMEINNKINNVLSINLEKDSEKLQKELFKNKDLDFIDKYNFSREEVLSNIKKEEYPDYDYQTLFKNYEVRDLSDIKQDNKELYVKIKDHVSH